MPWGKPSCLAKWLGPYNSYPWSSSANLRSVQVTAQIKLALTSVSKFIRGKKSSDKNLWMLPLYRHANAGRRLTLAVQCRKARKEGGIGFVCTSTKDEFSKPVFKESNTTFMVIIVVDVVFSSGLEGELYGVLDVGEHNIVKPARNVWTQTDWQPGGKDV
ncbi:hypothetical protein ACLB2K_021983 [Fragaria x ananassa]